MPERAPRRQTKTTVVSRSIVSALRREALELDVARAGDPARLVLVGLAHVDQLDLAALVRGADLVGVDVDVVGVEGVGHALAKPYGRGPRAFGPAPASCATRR